MDYDLVVIGGGINGVGIARDAAGRGLSVLLVEARDLASATSSASTKLAHGGLRYLEYYEFKLVKESLAERETMLRAAPHIIWPMKFVLPHDHHLRPYWMIRAGLFLYDFLSGALWRRHTSKKYKLPKSEALDFATNPLSDPLDDKYKRGFSYSDCWAEDSRLVVLNAMDAYERGAVILPRTACVLLEPARDKKSWNLHLENMFTGDYFQVNAGAVVNAAGPWVRNLLDNSKLTDIDSEDKFVPNVRLVKGSHIVVPKIYDGDQTFILQQPDGRIIFTIPYEGHYTLVGTTDVPFEGDAANVEISNEEIVYLCDAVNRSLKKTIAPSDVVWNYSGVRSLVDDGHANASEVTRDYKLYVEERHGPPLISVFGGKLTTYRKLAEHVVNRLSTFYPKRKLKAWTSRSFLPGGDMVLGNYDRFLRSQISRYTFLPQDLITRYARAYGTRMQVILEGVNKADDLGAHYGEHIYEAEIAYLIRYEFAHTMNDILWRRSKLGLHLSSETVQNIERALPDIIANIKSDEKGYDNASGD